jgi:hypothetical protein
MKECDRFDHEATVLPIAYLQAIKLQGARRSKTAENAYGWAAFDLRQTCGGFIVLRAEKFHFSADFPVTETAFGASGVRRQPKSRRTCAVTSNGVYAVGKIRSSEK